MIKFDDEIDRLFDEIGLESLPFEKKAVLKEYIYKELKLRTKEKLVVGMSDKLIDEFGEFEDQSEEGMLKWFIENLPDYQEREDYKQLSDANPEAPEQAIMSEFGMMKWMQLNCPDYEVVVKKTLEEMKEEMRQYKEVFFGRPVSVHEENQTMKSFKLDDNFLDEVGLSEMPERNKERFLTNVHEELESRVGELLSDGMSIEEIKEFAIFADGKVLEGVKLLRKFKPDYKESKEFKALVRATASQMGIEAKFIEDFIAYKNFDQELISIIKIIECVTEVISAFGSMEFLKRYRPDYPQVVERVLEELKVELIDDSSNILRWSSEQEWDERSDWFNE